MLHVSWIPIQDWGRHSIYIYTYYHILSIYTLYPRSEVALANIPWCTSWDMTCPGSCLTSGQVMVLMTCWWEFFDSKHLRLEPCLKEIHEPNKWCQMFRIGSVLGLSLPCLHGTVMIGERGKFVAWWGPKPTVRIRLWRCVQWCAVMTWHGFVWKRRTPKFQSVFDVTNVCVVFFDKRAFRERLLTADWICQDQLCLLKWSECASNILPFQFAWAASKIVHWRFFLVVYARPDRSWA